MFITVRYDETDDTIHFCVSFDEDEFDLAEPEPEEFVVRSEPRPPASATRQDVSAFDPEAGTAGARARALLRRIETGQLR